jgi:hypothetical protein
MTTLVRGFNDLARTISIEKKKINILNFKTKPIINLVILGLLLVILVFYLVEINQIVTLGFKVDEMEKSRDDLKKTNKNLEMEKMQLESLNDANQELSALNFVKIDKIDYLRPMAGSTLTKK